MGKTPMTTHQVINYKGMQYAPEGELGVVFLFSKMHRKLGYPTITRIQDNFPDCEAIGPTGKKVRIEFELLSGNFFHHKPVEKHLKQVDAIICWRDNWPPGKRNLLKRHKVEVRELGKFLGLGRNFWFHVITKPYQESYIADLITTATNFLVDN